MGLKSILGGAKKEAASKRPLRNESLREDPADEHKRVARRRLIGSVTLLMVAVVVLPLVLEDAPKPVASDIALQIPSRDLPVRSNPEAAEPSVGKAEQKADTKSDNKPEVKADAKVADAKAEPRLDAKVADAKAETKSESKPDPKPQTKLEAKVEPKPEPKAAAKSADTKTADARTSESKPAEPKAEPKAGRQLTVVQPDDPIAGFANAKTGSQGGSGASSAGSAPASGASGGNSLSQAPRNNHWVQIGAFGNEAKAREMASQLRGKGFPAVTEVVRSSSGELYRVRVGPLETRESASRARDNLAKSGFDAAVVQ